MRNLLIIGARGLGREAYEIYIDCKESLKDVECIGFLDDNPNSLDDFPGFPPIIDSVENYTPQENDVFICALGDPKWIKHYTAIIENKGGKFISLISPEAFVSPTTEIGEGCLIPRFSSISCNIKIGKHTYIGSFSALGHDAEVGNYCHLGSYTFMGGFSKISDGVNCHPRVNILPHIKIGENAILGAGSICVRNVKPNITVFGVPAKKLTF